MNKIEKNYMISESGNVGILRIIKILINKIFVLSNNKANLHSNTAIPNPNDVYQTLAKYSKISYPNIANQRESMTEDFSFLRKLGINIATAVHTVMDTITLSAISLIGFDLYSMIKTGRTYPEQLAKDLQNITLPPMFARLFGTKSADSGYKWTVKGIAKDLARVPTIGWIVALIISVIISYVAKKFKYFLSASTYTRKQLKDRSFANQVFYAKDSKVYPKKRIGPVFVIDTKFHINYMVSERGVWYPNQPDHLLKKVDGLRIRRASFELEPNNEEN